MPTKRGCAERAPLEHGDRAQGDGGTLMNPASEVQANYSLTPAEFASATKPNALWDIKGSRPVGDPPFIRRPKDEGKRPFIADSSFREAFGTSRPSQPQQYPEDVTHLGQLRPAGANASNKKSPFMQSEYPS